MTHQLQPNDCDACDHKRNPDNGWCYMFRYAPTEPCAQNTNIAMRSKAMRMQTAIKILERSKA